MQPQDRPESDLAPEWTRAENPVARARHRNRVLDANAADIRIIQARLNRNDLPCPQARLRGGRKRWPLVDFKAHPVAEAVNEALGRTPGIAPA